METYLHYQKYRHSSLHTAFRSEKALQQLKHVASVMQPMPYNLPTAHLRHAMKNTTTVWLARDFEVQAYCDVFTHQLDLSCQVLKFESLACTSWTAMILPHGDTVMEKYRYLTDAGIVHYWESKRSEEMTADWEQRFLKSLDFSNDQERASRGSTVTVLSVGFSDSVLKETFCLYTLGILISLVSFSVSMVVLKLEFYRETVQNGIPEDWFRP